MPRNGFISTVVVQKDVIIFPSVFEYTLCK